MREVYDLWPDLHNYHCFIPDKYSSPSFWYLFEYAVSLIWLSILLSVTDSNFKLCKFQVKCSFLNRNFEVCHETKFHFMMFFCPCNNFSSTGIWLTRIIRKVFANTSSFFESNIEKISHELLYSAHSSVTATDIFLGFSVVFEVTAAPTNNAESLNR